jgi:HAMP domain-containing protein
MFKTLTAQAIIPVTIAITGFAVICCILLYSVMKADLVNDAVNYSNGLADTIVKSTRYAMLKDDRDTVSKIITNVSEQKGLEHTRIFSKKGSIIFSGNKNEIGHLVDKQTAGCVGCHDGPVPKATLGAMQKARRFVDERGVEVLAITAPIYNEPECFNAPCHVHPAGQKVLGTLDIGLSVPILLKNLPVMRGRLIVFTLLILLLSVGGVAALLWRNVFLPIRLLGAYAEAAAKGEPPSEIPHCGPELASLAENIRTIVQRGEPASKNTAPPEK